MKLKLLVAFLFLISIQSFAQDKKWSVEANYSIIPANNSGVNNDIYEIGLKYRFADFKFIKLGASFNTGFSKEKFERPDFSIVTNSYYFQPRIFSEFIIPGLNKLHPSIAVGYSFVNVDSNSSQENIIPSLRTSNGGFNFNVGLSYDVTNRFFIQVQYDFINLMVRDEFMFEGDVIKSDFNEELNSLKIGVGFRF